MTVPVGECVAFADEVATTLNADDYFRVELNNMIKKNHVEKEFAGVHEPLDKRRTLKKISHEHQEAIKLKCFQGIATEQELEELKPGAINFVDAAVYEQLGQIKIQTVIMPYYIDPETSQISRNYVIDGEPAA